VALYREDAVVLRTYKLGEADRIVVLLTEGRGKVRGVAKGVRKTKSRFGSRLEPSTHVRALLYEGRQLDTVTQADALDAHPRIRRDLDRTTDALALLEAVDQVAQEGEAAPALYRMLVRALRTLDEARSPLLVPAFYWKLLAVEGVAPILDACARCGASDEPLVAFDPHEGGALCRTCRQGAALLPGTLEVVSRILGGDLAGALAIPPGPATAQVADLATSALEHHLDRRLRVVRLLGH
jgi:DNA repair protein RecO (recombination protein O)